jgi:RNA polymerase sigma-70 factor (ECF subfamily)
MPDEKKILKKFKEGNTEAFDTIYRMYSKKLFHFALGLIKDHDSAQDLVQEVFVNLWEKRSQVNPKLNFDNYIFTVTYNSIRKYFRKKSVESKAIENLLNENPEMLKTVDSEVIYNELLAMANKSIEKLPPKRKAVYKLSKQEGLKIKEIAEKLNISSRTAENHLSKALKYLKEELSAISVLALLFYFLFIQ